MSRKKEIYKQFKNIIREKLLLSDHDNIETIKPLELILNMLLQNRKFILNDTLKIVYSIKYNIRNIYNSYTYHKFDDVNKNGMRSFYIYTNDHDKIGMLLYIHKNNNIKIKIYDKASIKSAEIIEFLLRFYKYPKEENQNNDPFYEILEKCILYTI